MHQQIMLGINSGGGGTPFFGMPTLGGGTNVSGSARFGWVFTPTVDLICNTLRAQVQTSTAGTELVMVHRNSDGVLMASASIPTNAAGTWFTATVSNFTLLNGVAYTVSSRNGGTARLCRQSTTSTYNSNLTGLNTTGSVISTTDTIPTTPNGNAWRICDFGYV